MSTPTDSAPAPGNQVSRYAIGSAANMARSLLVILALVALLVAIVPRGDGTTQPEVDASSVVSYAVKQSGTPFEVPVGLQGWKATSARYGDSTDSLPTWQGVWLTPGGQAISFKQVSGATPHWVEVATNQGTAAGQVEVAGRTWEQRTDDHGQLSLVAVSTQGLTSVLSTTAGMDEVTHFVEALQPAAAAP